MEDPAEDNKEQTEEPEQTKSKIKSKKLLDLPENPGNLEDYLVSLKDFQKECEKTTRYIEAGQAETKIKEIKKEIERQKKLNYKSQQSDEKSKSELKHQEDFIEFNLKWDNKMKEYEEEAKKLEDVLMKKHFEAQQQMEEELEKTTPEKTKDSAELLNLKKREEHLVKQKLYNEANNVKEDRLILEKKEMDNWQKERKKKIGLQLLTLKKKQEAEMKALQKKIDAGQEEQRKMRLLDLEKFIQKGENTKNELEIQHSTKLIKFDKALKSGSNKNGSGSGSQFKSKTDEN